MAWNTYGGFTSNLEGHIQYGVPPWVRLARYHGMASAVPIVYRR